MAGLSDGFGYLEGAAVGAGAHAWEPTNEEGGREARTTGKEEEVNIHINQ